MPRKTAQTKFAQDFLKEVDKRGSMSGLADAIGLPDEGDWKNIMNIITVFRKESVKKYGFDILVDCIANARKDYAQYGGKHDKIGKEYNLVNKDSSMRYHFEFPESFVKTVEIAYPFMFRNKKHYAWFCKNFKQLSITGII